MTTPPKSFWIISAIALVWNILGIAAFIMDVTMSPDALAEMPEAQRALYENVPGWATAAYAVAVIGGTLGCIALLLKKSIALPLFVVSLAGVVLQMGYAFLGSSVLEVMGPASLGMPAIITAVGVFLIVYANSARGKGWIA